MANNAANSSTKAQALKIIRRMNGRKNVPAPKVIKAELVTKLNISVRMAATYYYNFVSPSGRWHSELSA